MILRFDLFCKYWKTFRVKYVLTNSLKIFVYHYIDSEISKSSVNDNE